MKGIQDVVKLVNDLRNHVDLTSAKHRSDMELLDQIKVRFSDYEKMEKKNKNYEVVED